MKRLLALTVVVAILMATACACAEDAAFKTGSKGDEVARLQTRLMQRGFLAFTKADGVYGESTKYAVMAFQQALVAQGTDIAIDGAAGAATLGYLYDEGIDVAPPAMEYGLTNGIIAQLQITLAELGILDGYVDGSFGAQTKTALEKLQQAMLEAEVEGAQVSGTADELTLGILKNLPSGVKSKLPGGYSPDDPLTLTAGNLYASSCILIDCDTGKVVYEKNADERVYPASTTKAMTLLLAVEKGKLKNQVVIPAEAADVPGDSSVVPVKVGESMLLRDLLFGMMINSGNDAANAVAVLIGGSIPKFVKMMNKRAQELGMTGTHYVNAHGYHDPEHYTTARDMGKLAREAIKNERFKRIVSTRTYTMPPTSQRDALTLTNTYDLLNPQSASYYPYAYGIKTGFTSIAGQCYIGAAEKDGKTLVIALMHSSLIRSHMWTDAATLFQYGYAVLEQ